MSEARVLTEKLTTAALANAKAAEEYADHSGREVVLLSELGAFAVVARDHAEAALKLCQGIATLEKVSDPPGPARRR